MAAGAQGELGALVPVERPEPPATGLAMLGAVASFAAIGFLLGVVTAFLVPTGPRVGVRPGLAPDSTPAPSGSQALGAHLAAAAAPSNGTVLSVGIALGFLGCLGLGILARRTAGDRLVALAPVSGWLVAALLALSEIHGDLVLPTVLPGITFLYAGVVGGAISLLPRDLLRLLRARGGARATPAADSSRAS